MTIHPESPLGKALLDAQQSSSWILLRDVAPPGRPIEESRAIAAAAARRWAILGDLWNDLMPGEQKQLIETARAMITKSEEQA